MAGNPILHSIQLSLGNPVGYTLFVVALYVGISIKILCSQLGDFKYNFIV